MEFSIELISKMKLISARGAFISAPPVLYKNDNPNGPILVGGFAELPLSLAKYAGINLTVVPANSFGSYNQVTRTFDGVVGLLQSNQSDYTLTPSTIDYSGNYGKGDGVILAQFLDQSGHLIASSPNERPNERHLEIQEFFFVLDRTSFQSILISFFIIFCWFRLICFILRRVVGSRWRKRLRLKYNSAIWSSFCTMTNQGIPSQLPNTVCHNQLILIVRYAIFLLMCIVLSGMRTEIVAYVPPPLINNLRDLLASDKIIVFDSSSRSAEIMERSPKGSLMNTLYERANEQALVRKEGPVFDVSKPSTFFFLVGKIVTKNRAYIARDYAIQIYESYHCIGRKNSTYYSSKESFHSTMNGLMFNEYIADELRMRIEKTYSLAMEAGLFRMHAERSAQVSTSIFGDPSLTCLNEYEWDNRRVNGVEDYPLSLFLPVIYLALELVAVSLIALVTEIFSSAITK